MVLKVITSWHGWHSKCANWLRACRTSRADKLSGQNRAASSACCVMLCLVCLRALSAHMACMQCKVRQKSGCKRWQVALRAVAQPSAMWGCAF
jgi:hypothetical protein